MNCYNGCISDRYCGNDLLGDQEYFSTQTASKYGLPYLFELIRIEKTYLGCNFVCRNEFVALLRIVLYNNVYSMMLSHLRDCWDHEVPLYCSTLLCTNHCYCF